MRDDQEMSSRYEDPARTARIWRSAQQLRAHLLAGHHNALATHHAPHIPTDPGEPVYESVPVTLAHWKPVSTPGQGPSFAMGSPGFVAAIMALDNLAHMRAERHAEPAWRDHEPAYVAITDRRLLIQGNSGAWANAPFAALEAFAPRVAAQELQLSFAGSAPMLLQGEWIPWLSVALAAVVYGPHCLTRPEFSELD